jgi:hypothetical protein
MYCQKCGKQFEDAKFCPECGTPVGSSHPKRSNISMPVAIISVILLCGAIVVGMNYSQIASSIFPTPTIEATPSPIPTATLTPEPTVDPLIQSAEAYLSIMESTLGGDIDVSVNHNYKMLYQISNNTDLGDEVVYIDPSETDLIAKIREVIDSLRGVSKDVENFAHGYGIQLKFVAKDDTEIVIAIYRDGKLIYSILDKFN